MLGVIIMKAINQGFALLFLAFLGLAGCVAHAQKKPEQPEIVSEGVSLQFDRKGVLVPVSKDGTPFAVCGDGKRNSCSLFKENITVTDIEPITIIKVTHKINPTCLIYAVAHAGKYYYYYDTKDPNCAHLNK